MKKMSDLSRELPDTIFVPLGRKGFHPINIKKCIKCSAEDRFVLDFMEKIEHPVEKTENGKKETTDYKIQCKSCNAIYYIRMTQIKRIKGEKEERMLTNFNILNEKGEDEGYLGTVYE